MKTTEAKELSFFYNPNIGELTLYSGEKFTYNIKTKQFQIDLNPHGESRLVNIRNKALDKTSNDLVFDVSIKGKINSCVLKSDFKTCQYAFKVVHELNQTFLTSNDLDKIDLFLQKDVVSHLYISKIRNYQLIDSLRIINEEDALYLIKNQPTYSKTMVEGIDVKDGKIVLESQGNSIFFELNVNALVVDIIQNLIKLKK